MPTGSPASGRSPSPSTTWPPSASGTPPRSARRGKRWRARSSARPAPASRSARTRSNSWRRPARAPSATGSAYAARRRTRRRWWVPSSAARSISPGRSAPGWRSRDRRSGTTGDAAGGARDAARARARAHERRRPDARPARQPRLRDARQRQRLVHLRRDDGRAAAARAAAGLQHRRQAARRRRRQPPAGGEERDAARPGLHGDQPLGLRGQGGVRRPAGQPARARRRPRHVLPRRHRHAQARHRLGARDPRQEAAGEGLHAAGRRARGVRRPPAPARRRHERERHQGLGWQHHPRRLQHHRRRVQGRPGRHPLRGRHAQASVGQRDRHLGGRDVPRPRSRVGEGHAAARLYPGHDAAGNVQGPGRAGEDRRLSHGAHHQQGPARAHRLHGDEDDSREQGRSRARPRRARRVRPDDGLAAREGRHPPAPGRRAGVPRERVDEIAAEVVLDDGHILTLDPRRPVARALAIAGGRVVATGGRADVRRWCDRRTRVVPLGGATVVPGLVDAHAHLDREGLKSVYPAPAGCRSIVDLQALLRRLAADRKPGEWIVTMPLGTPPFYQDVPSALAEGRWPTRADLDAAAPEHPVYVRGIWGYWNRPPVHSIANSRALALAGVTRASAAPAGVEIVKDGAGEPTGVFVEHNAIQVLEFTLMRVVPRFTHADRLQALRESQRRYAMRGVTAVYEGHGIAPEVLRVYRETHAAGALALRCTLALRPTWAAGEAARAMADLASWAGGHGLGDARLRVAGICLHYGGDAEVARILHASQPYTGWAGFVESANDPAAYREQVELAARHGLRVNTLVTRCLPEVLDVWEDVARRHPIADLRWVLVHLNAASAETLARIRRLGAVATTNPISYLYRSAGDEAAR